MCCGGGRPIHLVGVCISKSWLTKSEHPTPTRARDNQFRKMQDSLNYLRNTSLLNFWGWSRGFLFHQWRVPVRETGALPHDSWPMLPGSQHIILRGTKSVARKEVWTSVNMRVCTCKELRAKHDQASCYLRPSSLVTSRLMTSVRPIHVARIHTSKNPGPRNLRAGGRRAGKRELVRVVPFWPIGALRFNPGPKVCITCHLWHGGFLLCLWPRQAQKP